MRKVDVVYGVKERLNDLLGCTATGDVNPNTQTNDDLNLTSWSIQSSILENITRMCKGFAANTSGKGFIVNGFEYNGSTLSPGLAFTPAGEMIYVEAPISKVLTGEVWIKYKSEKTTSKSVETNIYTSKLIDIVIDNKSDDSIVDSTGDVKIGTMSGNTFTPEPKGVMRMSPGTSGNFTTDHDVITVIDGVIVEIKAK